jgi:hypothetical protein
VGLKRALPVALALPVTLALLQAGALAGQETVRSALVRADLTDPEAGARVRVEYTVAGAEAGASIPATLLAFASARPADLRVGSGARAADFSPGPGRAWTVLLPAEADATGTVRVVAEYTIPLPLSRRDEAVRGHVPILAPDRPPQEARPGLFVGELTLPAGWRVSEAFPTGLRESDAPRGGSRTLAVELPVVPSTLSFRAHAGGRWRPGLAFVLDVVAALLILGFSVLGWLHMRRVRA